MEHKQIEFFDYLKTTQTSKSKNSVALEFKKRLVHGGIETRGTRKQVRPLSRGKWTHLVLKSKKAKGSLSFLAPKNRSYVDQIIKEKAKKFGIKLGEYVNVGNHLHLKVKCSSRENFQKFLKSITCLIARTLTGAKKGVKFGKFWDGLAFTRVLKSSFEELQLRGYLEANRREAAHSQRAREEYLSRFNAWVKDLKLSFKGPIPGD